MKLNFFTGSLVFAILLPQVVFACTSINGMPDPKCTPGAFNPDVRRATLGENICNPHWSTKSIRPPTSYTNKLKIRQIKEYGYKDTNPAHYEEDHLISLEIGGAPRDPRNLWPEPYAPRSTGAKTKDVIENRCHKLVCTGKISLVEAQKEIATNWKIACK